MNYFEELKNNQKIFFNFMKEKYSIHFNANIFARDLQYAIKQYFEKKDIKLKYPETEKLMQSFSSYLEGKGDLLKLTSNSWRVNFFKPVVEEQPEKVTEEKE